jgi:putative transposase
MEFNGEAGHVHLLVHYPPKVAISKLVKQPQGSIFPAFAKTFSGTRKLVLERHALVTQLFCRFLR